MRFSVATIALSYSAFLMFDPMVFVTGTDESVIVDAVGSMTGTASDTPPAATKSNQTAAEEKHDEMMRRYWGCRHDPTWEKIGFEECQKLLGYYPRASWLDKDDDLEDEKHDALELCINQGLEGIIQCDARENANKTLGCENDEVKVFGVYDSEDDGDLVVLHDVFTEAEAQAVDVMNGCIRKELAGDDDYVEERAFEADDGGVEGLYEASGGNYVTFLTGMLQIHVPGAAAAILRAFRVAYDDREWGTPTVYETDGGPDEVTGLPDPRLLGHRCAEYLEYRRTGVLGTHYDEGSVYTISVAMGEPDAYEGGFFRLKSMEAMFKVPRRSAVVFKAETDHGVTPITKGTRRVFVTELWDNDDLPMGTSRTGHEEFAEYKGEVIEEEQEEGEADDFESDEEEE